MKTDCHLQVHSELAQEFRGQLTYLLSVNNGKRFVKRQQLSIVSPELPSRKRSRDTYAGHIGFGPFKDGHFPFRTGFKSCFPVKGDFMGPSESGDTMNIELSPRVSGGGLIGNEYGVPRIPEFLKECPDHVLITESALDGREVAVAFRPREEWPKAFKFFRFYR